jgi:hypothetical protein
MVVCKLTGGLGNLLYQIAATITYAKKWNMPYAIPTVTTNQRWKHYRFPGVHYEDVDTTGFYHYKEPALFYNQRPYDITVQDFPFHENIILEGHFLSHKYFEEYKNEILPLFGFEWMSVLDLCAIHVRRQDYLTMQQYLPVLPLEYYKDAIRLVIKKTNIRDFIIFSDDIPYCKNVFKNIPGVDKLWFSEGATDLKDIEFMSHCPVLISANSTFSLWSYYLNKHEDKKIICPEPWHGPAYGKVDIKDMLPEDAITIQYA